MRIGIAGLGLIGGSLAKAAKRAGHSVLGWNRTAETARRALADGAIDGELDADSIRSCEVICVALPPEATVRWIESMENAFAPGTIVTDCSGVKRAVCAALRKYATGRDWTFIGGHPMAGRETGGYGNAIPDLFDGASAIFTPYPSAGRIQLDKLETLCRSLGFARCVFTTPEEHDRMIAVTSQLAHAVSSAYARDPLAPKHEGFSAGSFADMTRVASVDPDLWTELFMANRDNLAAAAGGVAERLMECKRALDAGDAAGVHTWLEKGRAAKMEIPQAGRARRKTRQAMDADDTDAAGKAPENLADIRNEIDKIDDEMAALFRRRLAAADAVAAFKRRTGAPLRDPARERAIVARAAAASPAEMETPLRLFYRNLFEISRARQRIGLGRSGTVSAAIKAALERAPETFPARAVVACQGAEGAYSQKAACKMFRVPSIMYFNTFDDVFSAVEKGMCPYGVLPIENSTAGSVAAVYDLMVKHRFSIVRAARQKTDHALLGLPGATLGSVREVMSHPHALAQCGAFLSAHRGWTLSPASNTAAAARAAAQAGRTDLAAVASRECAELYGLQVLSPDISDVSGYTRFICISKEPEIYPDSRKMCIMATLPHEPGSLYSVMAKFAAIDVNLTKLESRPIPGMDFEFRFTFEFEASARDAHVTGLLDELAADPQIENFSFLGAYGEM